MTHRTFDEQIANFNRVVSSWDINQEYKVALLGMIASLGYEHEKSITSEPHWIPVTERLPETDDEVLTTYIVNGNKNKRYVETSTYYDGDEGYWSSLWDEYRVAGTRIEVLAWMPLPEPYKEVTE